MSKLPTIRELVSALQTLGYRIDPLLTTPGIWKPELSTTTTVRGTVRQAGYLGKADAFLDNMLNHGLGSTLYEFLWLTLNMEVRGDLDDFSQPRTSVALGSHVVVNGSHRFPYLTVQRTSRRMGLIALDEVHRLGQRLTGVVVVVTTV